MIPLQAELIIKKCNTGYLFKQLLLMCVKVRSSQHSVVVLSRIRLDWISE